jgi:hypothetical protein
VRVTRIISAALLAAAALSAQTPAVDRPPATPVSRLAVERAGGGFFGDFFRLGSAGEVWMIDRIRLWFLPASGQACGKELGDSIEKLTLLGALDNPPVPGQPACDCHALTSLAVAPLQHGSSESRNPNVSIVKENGAWRIEFQQVRWSVPAASDVLYSLRAKPRAQSACAVESGWSLAGAAAPAGHRLHVMDQKGVPAGLADRESPQSIAIQVWAERWK